MSTRPDEPPGSSAAWSRGEPEPDGPPHGKRYARGGELGRGGMGVVEAAVDTWLDRDVAVKRPRAEEHVARLAREARITARLVHPAIPPVYDVAEDEQGPYYTMPVLVGATLQDRLGTGASLRALVAAVATASRAAGYAHARGVVHRDLKPANVLLGDHGEVWVLDWGVALDPARPDAAVVGTPGFQAPEEGVPTPAADVFGLGRTLRAVLDARPGPHPELRAVVERATRPDPAERYADGSALAEDLERWLEGRLVQAHAYPARELLLHLASRWRAPLAVAAVAAVIVAAVGAGALRAQSAERARADRSLSASLAQQAAALRLRDARPEAEVLAAHSLQLAENPLARGVWMAWGASPSLSLAGEAPNPCEHPFVEPDGYVICVGSDVRVLDPSGRERWSAPIAASEGAWVGDVIEARRYEGDVVLLRRTSNRLEVWRDGARARTIDGFRASLGLADGPVPAVHLQRRVGRVDVASGEISWGPDTCEQIEAALVRADGIVVGCREPVAFVGTFEEPGAPIGLPGSPSVVAWQDGPVIGTFEGLVLTPDGAGWASADAGVGASRHVVPLGGGRLAVVGERGRVRLWSARDRVPLATLPEGGLTAASVGGELVVWGATARRYAVPADLRPVAFDRRDQGGIAAFDVSPSGARIVAGSATGEVVSWEVATGAAHREVDPGDATAKAVRFASETSYVYASPADGVLRGDLGVEGSSLFSTASARAARAWKGGLALLPWSSAVVLAAGEERVVPLPARPIAATEAGGLWVCDEQGGVHELDGDVFVRRFDLESPTLAFAASGDLLIVGDGASIEARSRGGEVRWRWTGRAPVTALAADADWIAAGDVEGRVLLLRPDGGLVAAVAGHSRRVSDVILRGDRLYSGSWDGYVRAWDLGAADADPQALVDRANSTWGLTLEAALAGADAFDP